MFLVLLLLIYLKQLERKKKYHLEVEELVNEVSPNVRIREKKSKTRRNKIDYLVKVAIFSSISALLYTVPFLQFKLPIFPQFLEFQFSNLPGILAGFVLGPFGGALVIVIKTLVKLPMSSTMGVGEAADLIIGVMTVVISSVIYNKKRDIKGGIIALSVGTLVWVAAAIFANWAVLIRWYAHLFGGIETIISMCKPVVPFINKENFMLVYLVCCCLPFNLTLSLITIILTFFTYKHLSRIFQKDFFKK